jgi:hypothetical protein
VCVLEGHIYRAAPGAERIYNTLTDEETDGNANCNLDHAQAECKAAVVLLHRAVVVSSKTTSLGKARLKCPQLDSTTSDKQRYFETHTGTRKSTPVTIEVNAVPRDHLE